MENQKETDAEIIEKTRVRIYVTSNRSERIGAIRRALSHRNGQDLFTEDVNDILMEEGCRKMEQELGIV
jgi:hypothetical protein